MHQCLTDRRGNYSSTVAVTSRAESSHPGTDGPGRGSYWPALPPLKIYLLNDPRGEKGDGGRRNKEGGEEQKTKKKKGGEQVISVRPQTTAEGRRDEKREEGDNYEEEGRSSDGQVLTLRGAGQK